MLDEPLTGLDAAAARTVKDLLVTRVRKGATIILTTHILEVAERLADRIGIIDRGRFDRGRYPAGTALQGQGRQRRRWRTSFSISWAMRHENISAGVFPVVSHA